MTTDQRLDDIFDVFDDLFLSGQFRKADTLLSLMLNIEDRSLIVGILVITAPASDKLPSRKVFLDNCRSRIDDHKLFHNLD